MKSSENDKQTKSSEGDKQSETSENEKLVQYVIKTKNIVITDPGIPNKANFKTSEFPELIYIVTLEKILEHAKNHNKIFNIAYLNGRNLFNRNLLDDDMLDIYPAIINSVDNTINFIKKDSSISCISSLPDLTSHIDTNNNYNYLNKLP